MSRVENGSVYLDATETSDLFRELLSPNEQTIRNRNAIWEMIDAIPTDTQDGVEIFYFDDLDADKILRKDVSCGLVDDWNPNYNDAFHYVEVKNEIVRRMLSRAYIDEFELKENSYCVKAEYKGAKDLCILESDDFFFRPCA